MTLWGGRFAGASEPVLFRFGESFSLDRRLLPYELKASEAWAEALEQAGVLTERERREIVEALREIASRSCSDPRYVDGSHEDVHTFVEQRLQEKLGPLARKLHTGRSRNDQVATDLRLWLREASGDIRRRLGELRRALVDLARRDGQTPIPGYTHLQRAQPLLFGHFLLAHFERFGRDGARLRDASGRANFCPLGSGALAGCPFPVDRERIAARLGFAAPTANSLDAVSDRDFAVETLAALALIGVHLSQIGEDIVLFSTEEFGLIALDDEAATGSSLMPQKKNPDPAELLRARGGALAGPLVEMLSVLKGLPSGYNRDIQEDKRLLFGAVDTLSGCLEAACSLLRHIGVRSGRAAQAAASPFLCATEIADHLVRRGLPFRDAHEAVGRAVRAAEDRGLPLDRLPREEWERILPGLGEEVGPLFDVSAALQRRDVSGGTAPSRVRQAIALAETEMESVEKELNS